MSVWYIQRNRAASPWLVNESVACLMRNLVALLEGQGAYEEFALDCLSAVVKFDSSLGIIRLEQIWATLAAVCPNEIVPREDGSAGWRRVCLYLQAL
jgi:hypothetical protein